MATPSSVVLRAELAPAEWKALRKLAVTLDSSVPKLVGAAVLELLERNGATPGKEDGK